MHVVAGVSGNRMFLKKNKGESESTDAQPAKKDVQKELKTDAKEFF